MAQDLARLVVTLEAQSTQLLQQLEKSEKRAAAWQRKVERSVASVANTFKSVLGGAAILGGMRAIAKATIEQEQAVAQLDAALKSTGGTVGFTSDQLQQFATDLQKSTTFSDDAILGLETRLLSFKNVSGDVFKEATKAAIDLSVRLGKDLNSSALLVGKALNDPIKGLAALSKAGVQFTADQKGVIQQLAETGHIAEAQGMILDALEVKFGGAAEAARNTFGGALDALHNAFGELLEAPDGARAATEAVNDFTKVLQDPKTVAAANALTSAVVNGFAKITAAIVEDIHLLDKFGEAMAKAAGGAAPGELTDLNAQLIRQQNELTQAIADAARDGALEQDAPRIEALKQQITQTQNLIALEMELRRNRAQAPAPAAGVAAVSTPGVTSAPTSTAPPALKSTGYLRALNKETDLLWKELMDKEQERSDALERVQGIKFDLLTDEQRAVVELQSKYAALADAVQKGAISQADANSTSADLAKQWAEQMDAARQSEVDSLMQGLRTEEEEIEASYERRKEAILSSTAATEEKKQQLLERLEQAHTKALVDIDKQRADERLSMASYYTGALATLMHSGNEKLFRIGKAAAIAQATIDGYQAIQNALAEVPYPFNFAAAAAVTAATAVQIANIASTNYAGAYDAGGKIPAGKVGLVGERGPELIHGPATVTGRMDTAALMDTQRVDSGASKVSLRIVNAFDTGVINDYLGSDAGEQAIVNTVRRNGRKLRTALA